MSERPQGREWEGRVAFVTGAVTGIGLGVAALIGIWALLTMKSTTFPTPLATFKEAVVLFSDPFYSNGPNDQGLGWNILFSLQRVAVGTRAKIIVEGAAGSARTGKVTSIGRAVRSKSQVQPIPVLDLEIALDAGTAALKPGQAVRVELEPRA